MVFWHLFFPHLNGLSCLVLTVPGQYLGLIIMFYYLSGVLYAFQSAI